MGTAVRYPGHFQVRRSLRADHLVGGPSPEDLDHLLAELGLD
ncbi:hypothetical protein [Patulibacter americanus]|nr:hypothetical protein [Patulibacter americanus]